MWQQIQSWPTPEMFIRRRGGNVTDYANVTVALLAMVNFLPTLRDAGTETSNGSVALLQMIFPGPLPNTEADTSKVAVQLSAIIIPTAVTQTQTETGKATAQLNAIIIPIAVSETFADPVVCAVHLNSLAI